MEKKVIKYNTKILALGFAEGDYNPEEYYSREITSNNSKSNNLEDIAEDTSELMENAGAH